MKFDDILIYAICYFGLLTSIYFLVTLIQNRHKIIDKPLDFFPVVSVIVPAYNEEHTIIKTLHSLVNLKYAKDKLDIIVVDDGSTDNTLTIAKTFAGSHKNISVLHKKNGGKGSALNMGLKVARGEFVGALDADSFVRPYTLMKLLSRFENENIVAVTPSLKVETPGNLLQKLQYYEYIMGVFLRKIFAFLGSIHVTPGPFTIYRKSFFDTYGGYDENNLTEDIEIALRIQKHDFEIENSVEAEVYTVTPRTFKGLLNQRIRWYTGFVENTLRYKSLFSRHHGNLGVFILPSAFLSVLLILVTMVWSLYRLTDLTTQYILRVYTLGFDFWKLFEFHFDAFYINLNGATILSVITLCVGIALFIIACRLAGEKIRLRLSYIIYLFVYWLLFGFWWGVSCLYHVTGRKVVWGKT